MLCDVDDRDELPGTHKAKGVVHRDFQLSSRAHATSYVDLRRVTLDRRVAPLVGRVLAQRDRGPVVRRGRRPDARRGPGRDGDDAAAASRGTPIERFVVRKAEKAHGLQRRIEGPDVRGRRVLALEARRPRATPCLPLVERRRSRPRAPRSSASRSSSTVAPGRRSSSAACPTSPSYEMDELGVALQPDERSGRGLSGMRSAGAPPSRAAFAAASRPDSPAGSRRTRSSQSPPRLPGRQWPRSGCG